MSPGARALAPGAGRVSTSRLQRHLLAWYRRSKRDLPWRASRDPYRIWVAEVMLQQTTVKTAKPYYEDFVARFGTLAQLAAAAEDDVLAQWSGLGYYHRGRNLLRGARHVLERHGGHFPRTLEAALAVPGVGLYTASAVLSIAFDIPLPVVDGNVRRVLARLFLLEGSEWKKDAPYYNLAEDLLEREAPGEWNQALMELGATVCSPRRPGCPACPLRRECRAREVGSQEQLPVSRGRRASVAVTVAAALVVRGGRVLLVRRAEGSLLGRFWELPQTSLESRGLVDLASEARQRYGLSLVPGELAVRARHTITFRRIAAEGYITRLARHPPDDVERYRWVDPDELSALPTSSLTKKLIRGLRSPQKPLPL